MIEKLDGKYVIGDYGIYGENSPKYVRLSEVLDTIGNVPDYDDGMVWEALSHAQRDVALLPSVQQQWNFEGKTNGDVMKAMFPDVKVKEKNNVYEVYFGVGTAIQFFNRQWWNSPYKTEGSEDKE